MNTQVIIASKNPVKIAAVTEGFETMFPHMQANYIGISVPSLVSDQPMSSDETLLGAMNRAQGAQTAMPEADFWVGIEGGIEKTEQGMECFAWIVIRSLTQTGNAKTGVFFLPPAIITLIEQGKELGDADDIVFGKINSKQEAGSVGTLTNNAITRTDYYREAVILACIPFVHSNLYI